MDDFHPTGRDVCEQSCLLTCIGHGTTLMSTQTGPAYCSGARCSLPRGHFACIDLTLYLNREAVSERRPRPRVACVGVHEGSAWARSEPYACRHRSSTHATDTSGKRTTTPHVTLRCRRQLRRDLPTHRDRPLILRRSRLAEHLSALHLLLPDRHSEPRTRLHLTRAERY